MKYALTIPLVLSVIFSQAQTFQSITPRFIISLPSGRQVDADSMYTALEKAYSRAETISHLRDSVIMLAKRIEALERRPSFWIDSGVQFLNNPKKPFVTGPPPK